ncbi:MAG TPA: protoporphyrinogen oxidase [Bacteroidales bacterium]|nr:protoporphyrinogen oxidase [Bacteroidales bacterium]
MEQNKIDVTIIGAGLTGLTAAYYLRKSGKKVLLLEKSHRTGGVINTIKDDGFVYETGPNTGIVGTPEIVELFDDLKDDINPEIANAKAKYRWIWKSGKWNALPSGPISATTTPLFSLKDKFRILAEPFRKPGNNPEESVADLVLRRMGRSYLDYAVDPFISGVYAGDPYKLITKYALPKLYNLEQNYGSFIKGAAKKKKEPKTDIEKRVSREVFSVYGGLKNLTDVLTSKIGHDHIILNVSETKVNPHEYAYRVKFVAGDKTQEIITRKVITTIEADHLPSLLPFLPDNEIKQITNLNYAKVVQLIAAYKNWKGKELKAFGGLIPSKEKRDVLGILFTSSLFENRAPNGGTILSVFMGGINKPEIIEMTDDEIKKIALKEIKETLKTDQQADLIKIFRYQKAIPQYELSSGKRFASIEKIEKQYPGLILAGNIRDGIGMADRIKQAKQIAEKIIKK